MAPPTAVIDPRTDERSLSRRGRVWRTAAWLVLVVGLVGSVLGAAGWRASLEEEHERAFAATASDVVARIDTTLQRAMDLTATARTMFALDPATTNADIERWAASVDSGQRYPESQGFEMIARVPLAELEAYELAVQDDPNPGSTVFDAAAILPAGIRPEYCVTRLMRFQGSVAEIQNAAPTVLAQADWCATDLGPELAAATDSGEFIVASAPRLFDALNTTILKAFGIDPATTQDSQELWKAAVARSVFVFAPIYRGGSTPATVAGRRAASVGWAGAAFDVGYVLDEALSERAGLGLSLTRRGAEGSFGVITAGAVTSGNAHTLTKEIDNDGGWVVTVSGQADEAGLSALSQSALGLVAGSVLTLLVFLLIRVLSSSRIRALELVDKRTGELRHQALHDALTGLPNRVLVLDRAEQLLARSRREGTVVDVLFIDLDCFKDINDSLGHAAGDELLIAVAGRFSAALRPTDTVGRVGGDEFVVVADGGRPTGGPVLVAQRLLDVLQEPFHLAGSDTPRRISASIGVASGQWDAPTLLRDADIALYEAKYAGRNRSVQFESRMHDDVDQRIRLDAELRIAAEADQFRLHYQPTFGIRDTATTGVEALLRWQHPTRGVLAPEHFLSLLEGNGLIVPVGRWVLRTACAQGAAWHRQGFEIVMSVNVSPRQMAAGSLYDDVRLALLDSGFDPSHLVVEITESTLMQDSVGVIAQLSAIKALGVRVAIDDFGTGYSSLAYLRQFPVDILKIDRSFITDIARSHESLAVVHALIQLGKTLGLETIAEGIEDEDQLDSLRSEDCETGQGFLISRPLPPDQMGELLAGTAGDAGGHLSHR